MDNDSANCRVYNIGPYGGKSRILDNFDLNSSEGAKRYDQVFDSQVSQLSHNDKSQDFSRGYDYSSV